MKRVSVTNFDDVSLFQQLRNIYKIFKGNVMDERLLFDMRSTTWIVPLLVLPITSYIRDTQSEYELPRNQNVREYLEVIGFPDGISSLEQIENRVGSSYIPICVLYKYNQDREDLQSKFIEMVYKVLKPTQGVKDGIAYPISELVDNIFDHSKVNEGWVFAQHYPTKGYVDLCIVDRGRGIANSYKEEKNMLVDDKSAIKMALQGESTKPEKSRGFGIISSKCIVCDCLDGEFVLISGSAALYSSKQHEAIYILNDFYLKGVIVSFRICEPNGPINIYKCLE